ncbi:MAG: hypothetical protein AB7N76_35320 [Planctomycetota bacterium]
MTARDIDSIIERLRSDHPTLEVQQLKVRLPADDDGLWFFRWAGRDDWPVQAESHDGQVPFLIEGDEDGQRQTADSVEAAVALIARWLGPQRPT